MRNSINPSSQKSNKNSCLIPGLLVGGCGLLLLCVGLIAAVIIFNPFAEEISSWLENPVEFDNPGYSSSGGVLTSSIGEEDYPLQRIRSPETDPEIVEGVTGAVPITLTLSDQTRLILPSGTTEVAVNLQRESTTIQLNQPGLETSGSTRVLEFELDKVTADFIPQLTIPAREMGELHPATVNIARVGPQWVNGEILLDQITYLPLTLDDNGDILIIDKDIASLATAFAASQKTSGVKLAAVVPQYGDGRFLKVKYVPMTFQSHLDWYAFPRLVRMIPDKDNPGFRHPADSKMDQDALLKPISNVIVLVHGHNEQEKDGSALATTDDPWNYSYKREVWDVFYKTFLETQMDQVDCTAFYEFIYPTFRSAYSPLAGNPVEPLGDTFAKAMLVGAKNDRYQLKRMREADMNVNVFITAHSMGGLVARAGVRQFDEYMQNSFRQLVTWGTPHHGSPLVSLGYIFRGAYMVNPGQLRAAHWFPDYLPEGDVDNILGSGMLQWILDRKVQLDTPGTRDLRWDNVRPLRLDEIFKDDTRALIFTDPGNTKYSLVDGSWLYNQNLKQFNESDPYYNTDKYVFFYGTTSKRLPNQSGETAIGATILPTLLQNPSQMISDAGGDRYEGESDGAVPLVSMAGMGIAPNRYYLGDLDHEEYYSSAGDKGRAVARATFNSFGLETARCECARVIIENLEDFHTSNASGTRDIQARLLLDPELAPSPGDRIQSAEAMLYQVENIDNLDAIAEFFVSENGILSGSFPIPEGLEEGTFLIVRVLFLDGTHLDSAPIVITELPCLPHPGSYFAICTCENTKCWWNGIEAMCSDEEPPREWYCADPSEYEP